MTPPTKIDPKLFEFATIRQAEVLRAVDEHGSMRAGAAALGLNYSTARQAVDDVRRKAALQGFSPEHDLKHGIAPGQKLRGTSTLYDKDGKVAQQWVKTKTDDVERDRILQEFATWLTEDVKPLPPTPAPADPGDEDLLCVYPMGDPHFGMLAWWADAGEDFNLETAERLTIAAIDRLVAVAPAARTALLLNLGDVLHADNQSNTSQSGHQLDVAGRWTQVVQVALRAMVHGVRRMLQKHAKVILRINGGNHDRHSAYALALMLDCYFSAEPRVEVDLSPAVAWYLRFGHVLIGSTHGDTLKAKDMLGIMAADRARDWGRTKHRYWYVGHVHHQIGRAHV